MGGVFRPPFILPPRPAAIGTLTKASVAVVVVRHKPGAMIFGGAALS